MERVIGFRILLFEGQKPVVELSARAFLDEHPFRSRRPWVFGDDVTDEVAFETVLGMGGVAVKVGPGETLAPYRLPDPDALHAWLGLALAGLEARCTQEACP